MGGGEMYIYLDELTYWMESFATEAHLNIYTGEYKCFDSSKEERDSSNIVIPKICTSKVVLSYLEQLNDKSANKINQYLKEIPQDEKFHHVFHLWVNDNNLYDDYRLFYHAFVVEAAKAWCNANNISYTKKRRHV